MAKVGTFVILLNIIGFTEILTYEMILSDLYATYENNMNEAIRAAKDGMHSLDLLKNITHEAKHVLDTLELIPRSRIDSLKNYKETQKVPEQYDFIIVGSGSAGSVLANRLSEIGQWSVLLLERGKPANVLSKVPVLAPFMYFTEHTAKIFMEPQENMCLGLQNQRMNWPRGTVLGGTSVINYMIYTRGHPHDFDKWASQGNPGWSYQDVLPYFLKSEMGNNLTHIDPKFHNQNGPLSVSDSFQSPLTRSFVEAGKQMGYPETDYTGPNVFGFSSVKTTTLKGRRHDVASAFLQPYSSRKNLDIKTSSFVTKILINEKTKTAYGVKYVRNGKIYTALAKKEVILSAGAYFSPQLLMLSGVGPAEHLIELGVPIIKDLPVGQNLHDHLTYMGLPLLTNDSAPVRLRDALNPFNGIKFINHGTGPWASIGGVEGIAYIKTPISEETFDYPDIEYIFAGTYISADFGLFIRRSWGFSDYHYNKYLRPLHGRSVFTIMPMLLHPKSIGFMKLRSRNPFMPPKFYGNYYTDPERKDIKTMIESIKFILKLVRTPAFKKHGVRLHEMPIPGCESYVNDFDQYWECALRTFSVTLHHQVGTCKMGPENDSSSVVDPRLRVYGIKNLRVADTSVIPFALSAHTNAPSVMVGEKAADLIKKDWSGGR